MTNEIIAIILMALAAIVAPPAPAPALADPHSAIHNTAASRAP